MPDPTGTSKIPTPELLSAPEAMPASVRAALTGRGDFNAEVWPLLTTWLLSTGLAVILVAALPLVAARAYVAGVNHVFELINRNLKPDAMVRVTQRTTTLSGIVRSVGRMVIFFLGAMVILSKLGINVAPILASAGIVGLAVGFGAQSLVKDVISGFFILAEDQYGVGDVVTIGTQSGLVEKMNLRITQLRNQDGQLITLPNGSIQNVVNQSKEWARAVLEVGVAYHEDPDRVMDVLRELGAEIQAEMPEHVMEPVEILGVEAFRDSEVVIKLMMKTQPLQQWAVARAFRRKIWYRFQQEGIEIPFPQRKMWVAAADPSEPEAARMMLRAAERRVEGA